MTRRRRDQVFRVDWQECRARGLCAEVIPERIVLDPWGYPVILGPVSEDQLKVAREAVTACPRQALQLRRA
jgi:ferredoxin